MASTSVSAYETFADQAIGIDAYGPTQNPVLKIVEWVEDPDCSPPETPASSSGDLVDEIPF